MSDTVYGPKRPEKQQLEFPFGISDEPIIAGDLPDEWSAGGILHVPVAQAPRKSNVVAGDPGPLKMGGTYDSLDELKKMIGCQPSTQSDPKVVEKALEELRKRMELFQDPQLQAEIKLLTNLPVPVRNLFDNCMKTFFAKGKDYARVDLGERLSNFHEGAKECGITPLQYWQAMFSKHLKAVQRYAREGVPLESEPLWARIQDCIVYLSLLLLLAEERGNIEMPPEVK